MKKLLLLTITLALAVMCLIAGRGTAYADVLDGDSNTVLLAPSSVCSDGDVLAVADNVDGGTILHLFSSDGLKSLNVSGETQKIRISGGKIYLLQKNKIIVCTPDDGQCKDFVVQEGVCDFDVDGECLYFWFRTGDMDRVHFKKLDDINSLAVEVCTYNNALHNMQLRLICAAPDGGINLFYTSNGNNCRALYEINGTNAQLKSDEQIGYNLPDFLGAVPCLDTVMLFDSNAVYALDARFDGLETEETAADLCFVKGDAADSGTIYLLTDQRLVLRFKLGFSTESGAYYIEKDMSVEIGTTENNAPLPIFSIENYVTATVEGYPSNIIYTAQALENENLMLSGMLDKTDEIVILNYDGDGDYYVLADRSLKGTPLAWSRAVVSAYHEFGADRIIGESNNGGDLIELALRGVDDNISYKKVTASRGKLVRAEPVAALYERGKVHHLGEFPELEDQLTSFVPGHFHGSPDRLDALVWALTDLMAVRAESRMILA